MIGLDVLLGGVTGLIGNVITGVVNYKTMKAKNAHEEKMVELETNAMREEAKMQIEVTKAEIEGEVELADAAAYTESIKAGNKAMFSEKWIDKMFNVQGKIARFFAIPFAIFMAMGFAVVDWLRGFMRPFLTLYLTGMSSLITWQAWLLLKNQEQGLATFKLDQALELYSSSTSIVIYLTVSCVTWWFGDRRMAKFLTSLKDK